MKKWKQLTKGINEEEKTIEREKKIYQNRISVLLGDITKCHVAAIVNAANETLLGGGGVDGAIHKAAGPLLLEECKKLGGCITGKAKITKGYDLPSDYVIHTVGPVYRGGKSGESAALKSCYESSLYLAKQYRCRSIAFPAISTGVYAYPKEEAAEIALNTVKEYIKINKIPELIVFVLFLQPDYDLYMQKCLLLF